MQISERLRAVAGMVSPGCRLADVGTDHAYIPIYLMQNGVIPQAVAMDINQGPLLRATENIRRYGLTGLDRNTALRRAGKAADRRG